MQVTVECVLEVESTVKEKSVSVCFLVICQFWIIVGALPVLLPLTG